MTTRALLFLCWLGLACMFAVALVPDFAITIFISWLVLAGMFQIAAVLGRA